MKAKLATRRFRPLLLAVNVLLVLLGVAAPVLASPTYPPTIQAQLGLAQAPDCTLCHRDDSGGVGTIVHPFGRTLVDQFGLTGGSNTALLRAALQGDDAEHLDSDGDGVPDIDELRAGTDPNVGASGVESLSDVPLPETGCTVAMRPLGGHTTSWPLLVVGLALARRRRSLCLLSNKRSRKSPTNAQSPNTKL